ncbi:transcription factor [Fusarium longipes]|uniref:Transcription factor n=1 Tax=Fusarium longipes TaxID=694270 RepID=A0A395SYI2_9HYPO|nr:transcription factor [Fusarium longipes]
MEGDVDEGGVRVAEDFQGRSVHSAPAIGDYLSHVESPLGRQYPGTPGPSNSDGGTWRWHRRRSQRPVPTVRGIATAPNSTGPFAQFASPLAVRTHIHPQTHQIQTQAYTYPQTPTNTTHAHLQLQHEQILFSHPSYSQSPLTEDSAIVNGHFGAMEQIETQASDLRFLAQVPVLNPTSSPSLGPGSGAGRGGTPARTPGSAVGTSAGAAIAYENQASPSSASVGDNSAHGASASNANKRKSTDDGQGNAGKQTRKSDEFKQVTAQLGRLQEEVGWLHQTVKTMQSEPARFPSMSDRAMAHGHGTPAIAPSPSHSSASYTRLDSSKYGSFRGPTSMAFSLDVANNTINNMGYKGISDEENQHLNEGTGAMSTRPGDPLHEFDKDEMVRLCRLHEEEIGIMYPVLNIQSVISHAKSMATFLESVRQQNPRELINDDKTLQLKIIMCCALVVEEHGHSDKAIRLFDSMETVLNRKLMAEAADVATLPILALVAGYRFLSNDEVLAWRVMGHVARLCLELGIHQRTGLMRIQDEEERKNALVSFWSAYVLDRRWAFATGLPFVVQDEEIDSQLPFPEEYPYLVAMITYSRIGAKVWRQVAHFGPVLARDVRSEELEHVDQELLQWYEQIPEEVKVRNWDKEKHITSTPSYNLQRLRIWTYLRLNQMRIWLYTPVLHSATSIMAHPAQSERVVDIAKDTIRYLSHLNNTTNLYRRVQVFYHQFLTSAIAVVFLASVHAPVRFSANCREEFYMALELVKDLSAKSWASQRLWRTIRSLKDVAPRFGLNPEDDPQSTAALGMIGLARGHMDQQQTFRKPSVPGQQSSTATPDPLAQNGSRIQAEMSRMFEGYVGLNGFQYNDNDGQGQGSNTEVSEPPNNMFGIDGTVFPQFKEMY